MKTMGNDTIWLIMRAEIDVECNERSRETREELNNLRKEIDLRLDGILAYYTSVIRNAEAELAVVDTARKDYLDRSDRPVSSSKL